MPQIVSGLDPKVRLEAYLAGQQGQRQLVAQQNEEQARRQQHQEKIMQAIAAHKNEQAKALADVNARAQMGDVMAMQQQNAEQEASGKPFDQHALETMVGVGSKITDPKARALWEKEFGQSVKQVKEQKQKEALDSMIQAGIEDDVIKPEEIEQRRAMGEEPEQLGLEVSKRRVQRRQDAVASEKNKEALAQVRAVLPMVDKNAPEYDSLLEATLELEMSPSAQKNPNAGQMLLDLAHRLSAPKRKEKRNEDLLATGKFPDPGVLDVMGEASKRGFSGGEAPSYMGGDIAQKAQPAIQKSLRRGKKGASAQAGAPDAKALMQSLREQGLDLNDPAVLEQVKQRLLSGTGQ